MKKLEDYIITIPDFPSEGIMFRDVTGVMNDAEGFRLAIDEMAKLISDIDYDVICGLEARGFVFGAALAYKLNKPFVPVRKKGKLPRETVEMSYDLEYGQATIEIHRDDVRPGQKVVIVDDLIATGGTTQAASKLLKVLGAVPVRAIYLVELAGLNGRNVLDGLDVRTVISYEGK